MHQRQCHPVSNREWNNFGKNTPMDLMEIIQLICHGQREYILDFFCRP